MEIDIQIDELTDCLFDSTNNINVDTYYKKHDSTISKREYKNWKFDWSIPLKNGYDIYELFVKGNDKVQGRIAVKAIGGVVDVEIVESAPHNFGHLGRYKGVGGHLFAIACQISVDVGFEGFVAFTAKSNLVEYYKKILDAQVFQGQRMYIDEIAATKLLNKYMRK